MELEGAIEEARAAMEVQGMRAVATREALKYGPLRMQCCAWSSQEQEALSQTFAGPLFPDAHVESLRHLEIQAPVPPD
eukprot:1759402-Lingulodinium_polyedra.AAC.1